MKNILTFCWPCCISVYLSQYLTNLMHKICFTISFISCLYMFPAHVLIIRRSKLHYTASGIITPIGGRLVTSWWWAHVLETCRGMKWNLLWNKFCPSSWLNTEIKNILLYLSNKCTICINNNCFSKHCYMFRCFYIIPRMETFIQAIVIGNQ